MLSTCFKSQIGIPFATWQSHVMRRQLIMRLELQRIKDVRIERLKILVIEDDIFSGSAIMELCKQCDLGVELSDSVRTIYRADGSNPSHPNGPCLLLEPTF